METVPPCSRGSWRTPWPTPLVAIGNTRGRRPCVLRLCLSACIVVATVRAAVGAGAVIGAGRARTVLVSDCVHSSKLTLWMLLNGHSRTYQPSTHTSVYARQSPAHRAICDSRNNRLRANGKQLLCPGKKPKLSVLWTRPGRRPTHPFRFRASSQLKSPMGGGVSSHLDITSHLCVVARNDYGVLGAPATHTRLSATCLMVCRIVAD